MASSTEGLVPITRAHLARYYDKYPFPPLSDDVSILTSELRSMADDLLKEFPATASESLLVRDVDSPPPHKTDENLWKNREYIEEILFLLEKSQWPKALRQPSTADENDIASTLENLQVKLKDTLKALELFQSKNADNIFNTVMTYMPQDFRGSLIRQQRERSERNRQAEVDALVSFGGTIRERYALLWKQQMERRRQLAQLGSATGVYKTVVKYLVGVPQVLLDFIQQINDDEGPMEEQRQRYGPSLYNLTKMVLSIWLFFLLSWRRFMARKLQKVEVAVLEKAVNVYASEFVRFLNFIGEVFTNSPFLISAEAAGAAEKKKCDDYKEAVIPAGKTYEVSLMVESVNSYIAWDFSLVQGKISTPGERVSNFSYNEMKKAFDLSIIDTSSVWFYALMNYDTFYPDIGFLVEYISPSGQTNPILPYRRYASDQGNFNTCLAGCYKLIWDNSYSSFFKKGLRYKVVVVPPIAETPYAAESEG